MDEASVTAIVQFIQFIVEYGPLGFIAAGVFFLYRKILRWGWDYEAREKDLLDIQKKESDKAKLREEELLNRLKEQKSECDQRAITRDAEWIQRLNREMAEGQKFQDLTLQLLTVAKRAAINSEEATSLAKTKLDGGLSI